MSGVEIFHKQQFSSNAIFFTSGTVDELPITHPINKRKKRNISSIFLTKSFFSLFWRPKMNTSKDEKNHIFPENRLKK